MVDFIEFYNNEKIYLDNYFQVWNKIKNQVSHLKDEFKFVDYNDFDKFINSDFCGRNQIYLNVDKHDIEFSYVSNDIFKTRSVILDLFSSISNLFYLNLGLYLVSGYYSFDENIYSAGVISKEGRYYECLKAEIIKKDNYVLKMILNDNIVLAITQFFNDFKLIHSNIAPHNFGFIILDRNKPDVIKKYKDILLRFNKEQFLKIDNNKLIKEQYQLINDSFCQFILELNYRNARKNSLKIINLYNHLENEVSIDELNDYLNKQILDNNSCIYKEAVNIYRNITKRKFSKNNVGVFNICTKCKAELEKYQEDYYLLHLFSSRNRQCNCDVCQCKTNEEVLILKK